MKPFQWRFLTLSGINVDDYCVSVLSLDIRQLSFHLHPYIKGAVNASLYRVAQKERNTYDQ